MTRAQRRNRAKAAAQVAGVAQDTAPEARKPLQIHTDLRGRAKIRKQHTAPVQPFSAALHPPAATGGSKLAMDEAPGVADWAGAQLGAYGGGYGYFPGFAHLAIQAQVPEIRRMVEIIATEATRKWIKIQGTGQDKADKVKAIEEALVQFGVRDAFRKMLEIDGYFGRGHIFVDTGTTEPSELLTSIGDGADAASRAKIGKGKLKGFKTVEAVWAYPNGYNATDPLADDWYKPQTWLVQGKPVHRTRLLTFVGREVPDLLKPAYSFGGVSLSQLVKPTVDNWLRTRQSVSDIVNAFSVMVLKTQMGNTLGVADASVMDRAELFNDIRDNRGLMILNRDTEEFANVAAPLSGLEALQAQAQEHMAAIPGIPLVKFFGLQPAGLNASSDGEMRSFFDWISAFVETGRPIIQSMLGFVQLHLFGEVDPEITFAFEPLWSMSDKELAEVRKIEADTAAVYIDAGVLDKDEERKRLADDPESTYHGLDLNAVVEEPEGEGDLADVDEGDDDAGSAVMSLFDRASEQRHDRSEPGRDAGTGPRGRASEAA